MNVAQTCTDVRYWSEILCCIILTHMSDLEVKVTNLEKHYVKSLLLKFLEAKRDSGKLHYLVTALILWVVGWW